MSTKIDQKNRPKQKLTRSVFLIAAGVFVLLVASAATSLLHSAREADRIASLTEQRLVKLEIKRQFEIAKRQQSQISYWDQGYMALSGKPDLRFVQNEIADWLWEDFGIQSSLVVTSKNTVVVDVFEDKILHPTKRQYLADNNSDLVIQAIYNYKKNRVAQPGGYMVQATSSHIPELLAVSSIRKIKGKLSLVTAQAIISDEVDRPVKGKDIRVLLTVKPFGPNTLKLFSQRTNLRMVQVVTSDKLPNNQNKVALPNGSSAPEFYLIWQPNAPFPMIMKTSAPLLVLFFALAGIGIWLVGRKFSAVINQLEQRETENCFLAQHDVLTKLPNRGKFDADVVAAIERHKIGEQTQFTIMSIDLDRFKAVNDTFGHQAGDVVIQTVAARFSQLIGNNGVVARMGGDEFAVLINDSTDSDVLNWLSDAMIELAGEAVTFSGGQATVGASIGIAHYPNDGQDLNELMRSSDLALYQAKETGRNKTCYTDQIQPQNLRQTVA